MFNKLKFRLWHFIERFKFGRYLLRCWMRFKEQCWYLKSRLLASKLQSPFLDNRIDGGFLRLRITNRCNAKCRFCNFWNVLGKSPEADMPQKWMYDYCTPLYDKIKCLILTSGETLIARDAFKFFSFISEQYPAVTIFTESNGIAFTRRWHELAADNLFMMHFSMNAVTEETYLKGVWQKGESGGSNAFRMTKQNVTDYCNLLHERNLDVFRPSLSMVINRDTCAEVQDFILMALKLKARNIWLFFDFYESDFNTGHFAVPELHNTLKTILKIERLLKDKVFFNFRLYLPLNILDGLQEETDAMDIDDLSNEFADILAAAGGRSVINEYLEREKIRKERGKKSFSFEEDFADTLHESAIAGKVCCPAPWKELDLQPDGNLKICGWHTRGINIKDFIKNDTIDWEKLLDHPHLRLMRQDVLCGNYDYCMECCPLNSKYKKIQDPLKYYLEKMGNINE